MSWAVFAASAERQPPPQKNTNLLPEAKKSLWYGLPGSIQNSTGHGPTIFQGYRIVVPDAQWVFQVDSDNEIKAEQFKKLWNARENYDAVIGVRDGRQQPLSRKIISAVSRLVVRAFYGPGVTDVNCPFRLMRAAVLKQIIQKLPPNTFAPNVGVSGFFPLRRDRILNQTIPHTQKTKKASTSGMYHQACLGLRRCIRFSFPQ